DLDVVGVCAQGQDVRSGSAEPADIKLQQGSVLYRAMDAGTSAAPLVDERPCRSCGSPLRDQVVDLGLSPLCQTVIPPGDADRGEVFYPLTAMVCRECWLVQVGDVVSPEVLFQRDYPYFSSYS